MDLYLKTEHNPDHESQDRVSIPINYLIREGQSLVFGRSPSRSDVIIPGDEAVSGAHFRITAGAENCQLEDLKSRNGTAVNGQPVESVTLNDGDHVAAGDNHFLVECVPNSGPSKSHQPPRSEHAPSQGPQVSRKLTLQILLTESNTGAPPRWLYVYLFPKDTLKLGRRTGAVDIAIPTDPELSGTHLQVTLREQTCRATDLDSSNGSFLNGLPFSDEMIKYGDEIVVGRTYIIVNLDDGGVKSIPATMGTVDNLASRGARKERTLQRRGYRIINESSLRFAPLLGRMDYPKHSMTLIVKGTFKLQNGRYMALAEEQLYPTGDEPYPGVEDPQAPQRYESDFAFHKPQADVLVVGHCHAPDGKPAEKLSVEARVGELSMLAEVYGKRNWTWEQSRWVQSQPEPFQKLELRYENSFGGPEFSDNLSGMGHVQRKVLGPGGPVPAPHIVVPGDGNKDPEQTCQVAGFGPEPKYRGRRLKQLGTYDERWKRTRWPWFAEDLSWEHFNAAPAGHRLEHFLKGDERIVLKNLHPEHSRYESALPGIRVRCFANPFGGSFFEVPMQADTLWIDIDAELAVIVWRGTLTVDSEECESLRHIYIMSENAADSPRSIEECHARLLNQLADLDGRFRPPPESPPDDKADPATANSQADEAAGQAEVDALQAEFAKIKQQVVDAQKARGIDPAVFNKQVEAEVARRTTIAEAQQHLPLAVLEFQFQKELWEILKGVHDAKVAAGQTPEPLPPEPQPPPEEQAAPTEDPSKWSRQRVEKHYAEGGSFALADLSTLDLSNIKLTGADLTGAVLTRTRFIGADLSGATLTRAVIAGSDLTGASLFQTILNFADFSGAVLHQAVLNEAVAVGALFSEAWLTEVPMKGIKASFANFTGADLTGALLSDAELDNADFSGAKLNRCNFARASLVEASFVSAVAREACFDRAQMRKVRAAECNLTSASLHHIDGSDSIWERANLRSANMSYSLLTGANLIGAVLSEANLSGCDLSYAQLSKSSLRRAQIIEAKLFEANLGQADLRGGNISGSCLFGSHLHEAQWKDCVMDSVNWNMTQGPGEVTNG